MNFRISIKIFTTSNLSPYFEKVKESSVLIIYLWITVWFKQTVERNMIIYCKESSNPVRSLTRSEWPQKISSVKRPWFRIKFYFKWTFANNNDNNTNNNNNDNNNNRNNSNKNSNNCAEAWAILFFQILLILVRSKICDHSTYTQNKQL